MGPRIASDSSTACRSAATSPGLRPSRARLLPPYGARSYVTTVVSAASAWEISIKKALGKLTAPDDLEHQVQAGGFLALPISIAHGIAAGQLARHHEDPFDRMLIAQAFVEGLTIVTRDKQFNNYGVALLPA